jgi:hypothetical protein
MNKSFSGEYDNYNYHSAEEMYFSEEFIKELLKVSNGEKTTEELRQEIIKKYARQ